MNGLDQWIPEMERKTVKSTKHRFLDWRKYRVMILRYGRLAQPSQRRTYQNGGRTLVSTVHS